MDIGKVIRVEKEVGTLDTDELLRMIDDILEDLCCSDQMEVLYKIFKLVDIRKAMVEEVKA